MSDSIPLSIFSGRPPARSPLRTSLISYLILFRVGVLLTTLPSCCLIFLTYSSLCIPAIMSAPEATTTVADSKPIDTPAAAPEVAVAVEETPKVEEAPAVRLSPYLFPSSLYRLFLS